MADKHLVCQGATCECKYGNAPDKLKVKTQKKTFINDPDGSEKLMATHKDIGQTFEKNTFGPCKQQPLPGGGYKPCQAQVTKWSGFYDKITLDENGGKALMESSKATCPIGGSDCITITDHGQKPKPAQQQARKADKTATNQLNPAVDTGAFKIAQEQKVTNHAE